MACGTAGGDALPHCSPTLRHAAASQERSATPRCKHTQQHRKSPTHPNNAAHWRPAPMRVEREPGTAAANAARYATAAPPRCNASRHAVAVFRCGAVMRRRSAVVACGSAAHQCIRLMRALWGAGLVRRGSARRGAVRRSEAGSRASGGANGAGCDQPSWWVRQLAESEGWGPWRPGEWSGAAPVVPVQVRDRTECASLEGCGTVCRCDVPGT